MSATAAPYDEFQAKADREIPVVVLEPRARWHLHCLVCSCSSNPTLAMITERMLRDATARGCRGEKYAPLIRRALVIGWIVSIGYYALRVTVFAMPDSCPDTVWESTDDPRCDWTYFDVAWVLSLPVLALATLTLGLIAAGTRIRSVRAANRSSR